MMVWHLFRFCNYWILPNILYHVHPSVVKCFELLAVETHSWNLERLHCNKERGQKVTAYYLR